MQQVYVINQIYLDMERLQVGEASEKARRFLHSIADTGLHVYGQNLDTRDNLLLAPSLQCIPTPRTEKLSQIIHRQYQLTQHSYTCKLN